SLGNTEDDITFDIILTNPTTPSSTLEYKVFVDIIGGPLSNNGNLLAAPFQQVLQQSTGGTIPVDFVALHTPIGSNGPPITFTSASTHDGYAVASAAQSIPSMLGPSLNPFTFDYRSGGTSLLSVSNKSSFFSFTSSSKLVLSPGDSAIFKTDYTVGDGTNTAGNVITTEIVGPPGSSTTSGGLQLNSTVDAVEAFYVGYLGHAGDLKGVTSWVGQLVTSGLGLQAEAAAFATHPPLLAEYPFLPHPHTPP